MESEPEFSFEKIFGLFIIFICALESTVRNIQLFYGISYFIVQKCVGEESGFYVFFCVGAFISAHSFGKFFSSVILNLGMDRYWEKGVFCGLLAISAGSIVGVGWVYSMPAVLLSRFGSGIGSSSPVYIRKMLYNLCFIDKTDWSDYSILILWVNRIGSVSGLFLTALFSEPNLILPQNSFFSSTPWLMLALISSTLHFSGFLLSLSFGRLQFIPAQKQSYIELPEKKIKKSEEEPTIMEINPDDPIKEKIDIQKYINQFDIIKEESIEESFNIEEVRFYSPRERNPKVSSNQNGSLTDRYEKLFQITPLDSIEDQGDNLDQSYIEMCDKNPTYLQYEPSPVFNLQTIHPEDNKKSQMQFAIIYRALSTALLTLIYESLPLSLIISHNFTTSTQLCTVIAISYSIGVLYKLCLFNTILKKTSYFSLILTLLCIGACGTSVIPYLYSLKSPLFEITLNFCIIYIYIESLLPVGTILLSDSISFSERSEVLNKNDRMCILIKGATSLITPILLYLTAIKGYFNILTVLSLLLAIKSLKIPKKFPFFTKAPYEPL